MAEAQGIRSLDLLRDGVIDAIIPERPDAADEPVEFSKRVGAAIARELADLRALPPDRRYEARTTRYRKLGLPR
jgi:acetyl-CoA carboxylase carboxyl transferase subunit beta